MFKTFIITKQKALGIGLMTEMEKRFKLLDLYVELR